MKKILSFGLIGITLLTLSSCDLADKAKNQYERIKNDYEEFVDQANRGPKPFIVTYQKDPSAKTSIISSSCSANQAVKNIYFSTQNEATQNIFASIKNLYSYPYQGVLKPLWDIRYINPVSTYINNNDGSHYPDHASLTGLNARNGNRNIVTGTGVSQMDASGSVVQSKCLGDTLVGGTTLNLYDAPEQSLTYAGVTNTFIYHIHTDNQIRPWKSNQEGNLMIEAFFDTPIYHNFEQNIGGSVAYNVFLYNPKIKKHLNFVIGVYAYGVAWQKEKAGIRFDPTTNIIHVATVIKDSSWWCTRSPQSKEIEEVHNISTKTTKDDGKWENFFRANISYKNLLAVLTQLKNTPPPEVVGQDFGLNPQDWEVTLLAIQYELEEQGGKATISGSFSGFNAYTSEDVL